MGHSTGGDEMAGCDVAEFFAHRSVLVTGGTGFLGKVLVEKLLRTCPDIAKIFLLIRAETSSDAGVRLQELISSEVFDGLRAAGGTALEKLVAVCGDVTRPGLGISAGDMQQLVDGVAVVFHSAARVRFDQNLKDPTEINVRGTQRVLHLCRQLPRLQALVHVSTTYLHPDRTELDEVIYPAPVDHQRLLDCVSAIDQPKNQILVQQIAELTRPTNTYGLTKAVAESLLQAEGRDVPVAIVRPSIVTAACREPMPGWVDNINGPTGIIAAVGKGFLRAARFNQEAQINMIPVDMAVNCIIAAAWHTGVRKPGRILVYNCTNGDMNPLTWTQLATLSYPHALRYPVQKMLWFPSYAGTASRWRHKINNFLYHTVPAHFLDTLLRISGKPAKLVQMYGKADRAMTLLEFYTMRQWKVRCDNVTSLVEQMAPHDLRLFDCDIRRLDWIQYFETYVLGVRRFIHKESLDNLPKARQMLTRFYLLRLAVRMALLTLFAFVLRLVGGRFGLDRIALLRPFTARSCLLNVPCLRKLQPPF